MTAIGADSGIALFILSIGCFITFIAIVGYLFPQLRRVERELPDAVENTAPTNVLGLDAS